MTRNRIPPLKWPGKLYYGVPWEKKGKEGSSQNESMVQANDP